MKRKASSSSLLSVPSKKIPKILQGESGNDSALSTKENVSNDGPSRLPLQKSKSLPTRRSARFLRQNEKDILDFTLSDLFKANFLTQEEILLYNGQYAFINADGELDYRDLGERFFAFSSSEFISNISADIAITYVGALSLRKV
jgi:hypothetical protein